MCAVAFRLRVWFVADFGGWLFECVVGLGLVCFGAVLLILMWCGWFTVDLDLLRDVFDFGRFGVF